VSQSSLVNSAKKVQRIAFWAAAAFVASLTAICLLVASNSVASAKASQASLVAASTTRQILEARSANRQIFGDLDQLETLASQTGLRLQVAQSLNQKMKQVSQWHAQLGLMLKSFKSLSSADPSGVETGLSQLKNRLSLVAGSIDQAELALRKPEQYPDFNQIRVQNWQYRRQLDRLISAVESMAASGHHLAQQEAQKGALLCVAISISVLFFVQLPLLLKLRSETFRTLEMGRSLDESNAEANAINCDLNSAIEKLQEREEALSEALDDMKLQTELHHHASRRFQSLFDGLPVGCFTFDTEQMVFEWNPQMSQTYGIPTHYALLHPIQDVLGTSTNGFDLTLALRNVLEEGMTQRFEWAFDRAGFEPRVLIIELFPLRGSTGDIVGGIGCATDSTEQSRAASDNQRLASTQEAILNSTEYLILTTDLSGNLTGLNRSASQKLKLTNEELGSARKISSLLAEAEVFSYLEQSGRSLFDLCIDREGSEMTLSLISQEGERIPVQLTFSRIVTKDSQALGYVAMGHEVGQQQEREHRLKLLSMVAEQSIDGVAILNEVGDVVFANDALAQFLSTPQHPVSKVRLSDLDVPLKTVQRVLIQNNGIERIVRIDTGGVERWAELVLAPLVIDGNSPEFVLARVHDITTERAQSNEIRANEARLRAFVEHSPLPLAMFDRNFSTLAASLKWCSQYELDPETVVGVSPFSGLQVLPSGWESVFESALMGEILRSDEDLYLGPGGDAFWMKWEVRPWFDHSGEIGGVIMMTEDITSRRTIEKRVRDSEERFELAVQAASVGIWDWNLVTGEFYCSTKCLEALRVPPDEEPYRPAVFLQNVHPDDSQAVRERIAEQWECPGQQIQIEYRLPPNEKEPQWIQMRAMALTDEEGEPIRMVGSVEDITERKKTESLIKESERRLRDVIDASGEFIWETDSELVISFISDKVTEVLGTRPQELTGKSCLETVHPSDQERILRLMAALVQTKNDFRELIYQGATASGAPIWLRSNGVAKFDSAGVFLGYRGTTIDITREKEAELMLEQAHRDMVDILESISDYFLSVNGDDVITYINETAAEYLGRPVELLIGRDVWEVFQGDTSLELRELCELTKHTKEWRTWESYSIEEETWMEYRIYNTDSGLSIFFQDITERRNYQEQIEHQMLQINEANIELEIKREELQVANQRLTALASTDGLTGLKNHKVFQEYLTEQFAKCQQDGTPLSVILMDVDKFKQYNDSFGHPAGDEVLRGVAALLTASVPEPHLVARYGGEEFVVVVVGLDPEETLALAEVCRSAFEARDWAHRPVTASFGVAMLDGSTQRKQDLIEGADKALYRSKESGRNRVTLWAASDSSDPSGATQQVA
jgi:diguanylate cyclase (GGDEF)-like protein/PAS domain S-box-containing protein